MICTLHNPASEFRVDTDKIAERFLKGKQLYVQTYDIDERIELIEFLEDKGFRCMEDKAHSRDQTITSRFPLVIEPDTKSLSHMENVTVSAAAAASYVIMGICEFYLLCSLESIANIKGGKENGKQE